MGRYAHGAPRGRRELATPDGADGRRRRPWPPRWPQTGLTDLADRLVTGSRAASASAPSSPRPSPSRPPSCCSDEPLNNLDLNHQLEIMQLLAPLHATGRTIAVVLHDLNMAAQYCDELLLLDHGRLAARGKPARYSRPASILEVFRVRVAVHRQGQRPYVTPLWTEPTGDRLAGEERAACTSSPAVERPRNSSRNWSSAASPPPWAS